MVNLAFICQPGTVVRPPVEGDAVTLFMYHVAQRLPERYRTTIYSSQGTEQADFEEHKGVGYRRVRTSPLDQAGRALRFMERLANYPVRTRPVFASSLYYLGYIRSIAADLRRNRFDIAHLVNYSQFIPIIRKLSPQTKIVLQMQCDWLNQLDAAMIGNRLRQVDLIVGCSEFITDNVRRRFPDLASRCVTVYNGVDADHFVPSEGPNGRSADGGGRLLYVGRVSPEKGLHVLLEAFDEVAARQPLAELEIVGPNATAPPEMLALLETDEHMRGLTKYYDRRRRWEPYFAHLESLIAPRWADRVSFVGPVPQPRLAHHYRAADVSVLPSVCNEACSTMMFETMASEVPIVGTRRGGTPDVVEDGVTGLLVKHGDPRALAEALCTLLGNGDLRRAMGRAGRQRVRERFSWDGIAADVERHFASLVSPRR
jgi:spore coat protein SA